MATRILAIVAAVFLLASPGRSEASPVMNVDLSCGFAVDWIRDCPAAIDYLNVSFGYTRFHPRTGERLGRSFFEGGEADVLRSAAHGTPLGGFGFDFELFNFSAGFATAGDGIPDLKCTGAAPCLKGRYSLDPGERVAEGEMSGSVFISGYPSKVGFHLDDRLTAGVDPLCGGRGGITAWPSVDCFSSTYGVYQTIEDPDTGQTIAAIGEFTLRFTGVRAPSIVAPEIPDAPEPTIVLLLGSGLCAYAWRRRRVRVT